MDTQDLQRLKNRYDIIGNDALLNRALETAAAVAPTDLTVLVTGESGVGKESIPRIIHDSSRRKNGKYFAVNCGAIPEGTIDSELFGHEKGSFTGATEARKGYFEEANGGTLFLDEIGELPMSSQAKLLRVLQSGEYIRVGSSKVGKTDVRVIAATNVNLLHAVSQGKFREDLYYRLNAIQISMPALRDRKDDIYLLFRKFTADFSEKYSMRKVSLSRDAISLLMSYRWPGNIRQLKNVAETVAALESEKLTSTSERCEINALTLSGYLPDEKGDLLLPATVRDRQESISDEDRQKIFHALYSLNAEIAELKKKVENLSQNKHESPAINPPAIPSGLSDFVTKPAPSAWEDDADFQENTGAETTADADSSLSLRGLGEDLIRKALERHNGNRKKAAQELGISERTLYRRLPEEYRKLK